MNQLCKLSLLLLIVLAIFGCAQAPMSSSFPITTQQKLQSVSHWNIIADDIAEQIKIGLTQLAHLPPQNIPFLPLCHL